MLTVDFDQLTVKKDDIVLDAGCGFGRHSLEFLKRGARVYSMDMDEESLFKTRFVLAQMKEELKDQDCHFMVHSGDALNLPFNDQTFDNIISSELLQHVDDDFQACKESTIVLK